MKHITLATIISTVATIGLLLLNTWVYPTQDGVTFGVGSYGYHISFTKGT